MGEKEIMDAAKSDMDAQPVTAMKLKKFKRVRMPKTIEAENIRNKSHLSSKKYS